MFSCSSIFANLTKTISLIVSLCLASSIARADLCLANPDWGIIVTDHGYSDVLMDLRVVDGVSYKGREYLSGEYAHSVAYVRDGVPVLPIWLEPDFIFPDWTTNSNFTVVSPVMMVGVNGSGLPVFESIISNPDLEIKIISEMMDNGVVGIQMGMTAQSSPMIDVAPITSNRYVMRQRFEYKNISGVQITDINIVQMLHGLVSLVSLKDDRPYPPAAGTDPHGFDAAFIHDTTVIGQDGENGSFADPADCEPGAVPGTPAAGIEHFDVITFHTPDIPGVLFPAAIDSDYYGSRSAGDSHVTGKPGIGTHLNIETGAMNGSDFFDPGDGDYPPDIAITGTYGDTDPDDFWVAGAQAHDMGGLDPNDSFMFEYVLSLQTSTVEVPSEVNVPIPFGVVGVTGVLFVWVYRRRLRVSTP